MQAYEQKSDAGAVEEAVFDLRWQMVLDCVSTEEPPFLARALLVDFRRRLVEHNLDKRLLERTVELAEKTGEFGARQLKVALDSAPLWGAGRVEDTFNLIGHAMEVVVDCAAQVLGVPVEKVRSEAKADAGGRFECEGAPRLSTGTTPEQQARRAPAVASRGPASARIRVQAARRCREAAGRSSRHSSCSEKVLSQDLEPDPKGRDAHSTRAPPRTGGSR